MLLLLQLKLFLMLKVSLVWALVNWLVRTRCSLQIMQPPRHGKHPLSSSGTGGVGRLDGMMMLRRDIHFCSPTIGMCGIAACILELL